MSPADCRLNIFSSFDLSKQIWIKGKNFTLKNLLKNEALEKKYEGCTIATCRLAPQVNFFFC